MKMAMTSVSSSSPIFVSSFRRENGRRLKGRTTAKNFVSFFGTFSKQSITKREEEEEEASSRARRKSSSSLETRKKGNTRSRKK